MRSISIFLLIFLCVGCVSTTTFNPSVAVVATERRTLGAQTDDAAIELKAIGRAIKITGEKGRVVVTSYNRSVLLTGEVSDERMKAEVQKQIETISGIKSMENDLVIAPLSSAGMRFIDAQINDRVKAAISNTEDLYVNAFKVHTDRSVVYLMGRVTAREAKLGGEVARNAHDKISKVVMLFEYIYEDEAKKFIPKQANNTDITGVERQKSSEERRRLEEEKRQQEQQASSGLENPNKLPSCHKDPNARYHNCWGTYRTANGDKYEGEFKDANFDGHGTFTYAGGAKYVGEWKKGSKHGLGTFNYTDGSVYAGQWLDGKSHGNGRETYADGAKYVGAYKDGMKHGQGTFTYPDGSVYAGEFLGGKPHGKGRETYPDGRLRFEGIFENGTRVRAEEPNLPNPVIATNIDRTDIDREREQLLEERRRFEEEKRRQEQQVSAAIESQRQQLAEERRRLEEEKRQQQAEKNTPNKQTAVTDSRRRLALVIGNASYKNSPLRNPTNDADLISNALSSSGFIVSRYDNLTYAKMREVVRTFGEKLNRGDVGLFYFSGHAVQYRGKNYLLPINEDLKYADEIPSTAMEIDFVLGKMETAKNDLNIVILDACRNNPLGNEARNLDRGLTTISAAQGTFIAFSTSPGNVALDGAGRNSPYTKNLAQAILKGGLTLEQVFKEVRRNVINETNSQQVPWENSSILGDFYFK